MQWCILITAQIWNSTKSSKEQNYTSFRTWSPKSISMITREWLDDIWITWINNAKAWHTKILSTCCPQINIVSAEMVDPNLGKHGVVFNLGLAERWAIVRYQNQLPFGATERAEDGFVTETVLAALHNQGQPVVYVLMSLLRLLPRCHFCCWLLKKYDFGKWGFGERSFLQAAMRE